MANSPRQREDHARYSSKATAIESLHHTSCRALRHQREFGPQVAQEAFRRRYDDGTERVAQYGTDGLEEAALVAAGLDTVAALRRFQGLRQACASLPNEILFFLVVGTGIHLNSRLAAC